MSIDAKSSFVALLRKYPLLFGCGMISLILLGVLYMRSDLITAQQEELDKYSTEGKRYRANIANAAQMQEQLDYLVQANNAVADRALKAGALAQNLQYFYRLESETGVRYIDLRPSGKPAVKGKVTPVYVPLNYVVTITGTFPQVIRFLRQLEHGEYFCRITAATASGTGGVTTINLNLDILGVP
jgi:hypothetical protein